MFQFWVNWNDEIRTLHVNELYDFLKILFRSFGLLWKLSSSSSYQTVLSLVGPLKYDVSRTVQISGQQRENFIQSEIRDFHLSSQKANVQISVIVGSLGEIQITTVRNLPPVPSNTMVFHLRIVSGLICKPSMIVFWLRLFCVGPVHSNL